MKKNLISVIILALVFANVVLTGLMVFTILPETQKANSLIENVASAINLELKNGSGATTADVPIENIETYQLKDGEKTTMTINLAKDEDGSSHFAVLGISLSLDKTSEGYTKYGTAALDEKSTIILNDINDIVRQYTIEQFNADTDGVKKAILKDIQNMFGKDFVIGVNFSTVQTQ
ncbi:Flagellar basal body-associated protein FliL [Lachnospiraceae bacterium C7]|nr:Flagellar basal body-associated protein FliL [Lachnospiraceae bacterium C7]